MKYNIIATLFCLVAPLLVFYRKDKIKYSGIKDFIKKNKYNIIMYMLLVVGFGIRLINIQNFPNALSTDEASSGYEAYSILNYGIDRNGNTYPVFLESWGNGQNALLTYLIIPFIKVMGLCILSVRLPMAILGCISLVIMYKLIYMLKDKKTAIIGLAFFVICPWHIMKSRWGLESNLLPDMVLIAVYFIMKFIKNKDKKYWYFSAIVLGLCAYAYGTAYLFLPTFSLILLIHLMKKKVVNIKDTTIFLGIIIIISFPIILMLVINTFGLPEMKIFNITIPLFEINRFQELCSIFSSQFLINAMKNIRDFFIIFSLQEDGWLWNSIGFFGIDYVVSVALTFLGIYIEFKEKKHNIEENKNYCKDVINIWFIASLALMCIYTNNINRANIIIIPIIYYTIIGLKYVMEKYSKAKIKIISLYIVLFVMFSITYFSIDFSEKCKVFNNEFPEVINYLEQKDAKNIYIQYIVREPYIYTLFYSRNSPYEYLETVQYKDVTDDLFKIVESYGKYKFYIPEEIKHEEGTIYVVYRDSVIEEDYNEWKITDFGKRYLILENLD